jgi:hypothetical protein
MKILVFAPSVVPSTIIIEEVGRLLGSGRIADFTNEQFHNAGG